jgi:hypothetical protein
MKKHPPSDYSSSKGLAQAFPIVLGMGTKGYEEEI